jgi:hypothetical protein
MTTQGKTSQRIRTRFSLWIEGTRARYDGQSVAKYLKALGIPKTRGAFRDMVASGSSEDLESKKGLELIACLRRVTFLK